MAVKLCKDCKHFSQRQVFPPGVADFRYASLVDVCNRPIWLGVDLVTGKLNPAPDYMRSPSYQREGSWLYALMDNRCGERGRFWQPKGKVNDES